MNLSRAIVRPLLVACIGITLSAGTLFKLYFDRTFISLTSNELRYQELIVQSIKPELLLTSLPNSENAYEDHINALQTRIQRLVNTPDFCCIPEAVKVQDSLSRLLPIDTGDAQLSNQFRSLVADISKELDALLQTITTKQTDISQERQRQDLILQQSLILAATLATISILMAWWWIRRLMVSTRDQLNRKIEALSTDKKAAITSSSPLALEFEETLNLVSTLLRQENQVLHQQFETARAQELTTRSALETSIDEAVKLIDTLNAPIFAVSKEGSITLWNKTIEAATGLGASTVFGQNFIDVLTNVSDISQIRYAFEAAQSGRKSRGIELNIAQRRSAPLATIFSVAPMTGTSPTQRGVIFFGQDITALKQANTEISASATQLQLSLDRLDVVLHSANAIVWDWNLSSQDLEFIGQSRDTLALDFASKPMSTLADLKSLIHAEELDAFERAIARHISKDKPLEMHCRLRQKDGGYRWFLLNGQLLSSGKSGNQHIVGSLLDMNDRIEQEHQIWRMAHLDALTQLPNRSLFNQRFEEKLGGKNKRPEPFSVAILDINDFKQINDARGHVAGDRLLTEFAELLQSHITGDESLVARLGGDEFAMLISPALSDEDFQTLSDKLINASRQLVYTDSGDRGVQFSLGMARYPEHGLSMEDLLRAADTAMYRAKRDKITGSRFQLFHAGMDEIRIQRAQLRDLVAQGLENDEFRLMYQPIIALGSGDVVSAEALLRWPSGPGVAIPDIISVAEDSGLILKLSEIIFDQAFSLLARLQDLGLKQTIAVNLSGVQFRYQDIAAILTNYARAHGADTHRLIIEITESIFLDNIEKTQKTIRELSQHGVRVAIDDFGTGYSSLAYLQKLTVDWIKVDQSFITDINESNPNYQIVNAIVQMGQALNMGLVAEGVENLAELEQLAEMGCERVQGYYFSKPLSDNDFIEFASKQSHPWQIIVPEPKVLA
jgi:diguanylate cyclase (GGDEF)-like protein/PAS domain S-box-containing protein